MLILEIEDESNGADDIPNPTDEEIKLVLSRMKITECSFAILSYSERSFVQAAMHRNGFVIEYADEATNTPYRTARKMYSAEEVAEKFIEFKNNKRLNTPALEWGIVPL